MNPNDLQTRLMARRWKPISRSDAIRIAKDHAREVSALRYQLAEAKEANRKMREVIGTIQEVEAGARIEPIMTRMGSEGSLVCFTISRRD